MTNVSWCVNFQGYEGCRHPVQLYAAAGRAALGGFLLFLNKKKHKNGFIFWMFLTLMGVGRFFCDFVRYETRFLGLSFGQYLSVVMIIVGIYVLIKYYRKELTL